MWDCTLGNTPSPYTYITHVYICYMHIRHMNICIFACMYVNIFVHIYDVELHPSRKYDTSAVCMYKYMYIHIYVHLGQYTYVYVHVYMCTHVNVWRRVHNNMIQGQCTCISICTYMYIYIYVHMSTCGVVSATISIKL